MKTIEVEFNQAELNTLTQLLDVAVKSLGITGAKAVMPLLAKLEIAVAEANAKPSVNVDGSD